MSILCSVCMTENEPNAHICGVCGFVLQANNDLPGYHLPRNSILRGSKYRIQKILGEGAFGITYRAIDLTNNKQVAIKENWPEKGVIL